MIQLKAKFKILRMDIFQSNLHNTPRCTQHKKRKTQIEQPETAGVEVLTKGSKYQCQSRTKRPKTDFDSGMFEIQIQTHLTSVGNEDSDLLQELVEAQRNF